jgi:hypothetical protein
MQYAPNVIAPDSSSPEVAPSLNAFIVYEDIATGKKAKEVCDMAAERLGPDWKIQIEMSSFKSLRTPRMKEQAMAAVVHANFVIFSCHDRDLPFEVWAWTELWLANPVPATALVVLVAGAPGHVGQSGAVEKYLAGAARGRGLDYFSHLYNPLAGTAAEQPMPVMQKEPNHDSSCATTHDRHSG